ncbi:TonB-dependent receptor [Williamwhitmania taraxaci]|uniref:Outer membrane receptor proteins, mostly Fe transport n=1 Tax=Williamwhitmania taraxaci TaxID=1640674 RepID=A0A1G6RWA5_9BACT|nr:TonB-dependent receptor [Williamwhitmania taraxaci]SDD08674.1 Outer membrane receptor proteins, mostly Fe transport [Williamwhitmania taraxaci]
MKKLLFTAFVLISAGLGVAFSQVGLVKGTVLDKDSRAGLPGVTVGLAGSNQLSYTDAAGNFELKNIPVGEQTIEVVLYGYTDLTMTITVVEGENNLGELAFAKNLNAEALSSINSDFTIGGDELDSESSSQNVSGMLQSSSDVFTNIAGFTFSSARFRVRGYDSDNSTLYMNGITVNDPESGWGSWSQWGGLNDVTRNKETRNGLEASRFSFGNIGGITNINTRPSAQRKGFKASYARSNRSYTDRVIATYSSGAMENGWAYTVSGSRRYAKEGYTEGTSYDAWAYFGAIEKKFNDKHTVALTVFGAPVKRGMAGGSTQEAYDLVGSNFYNPNWGWQDGEKRNSRIRNTNEPMAIFNHFWKISDKTKLTSSVGYSFGRNGSTALNWYDAPDPRPDYYRYLPSYNVDAGGYNDIVSSFQNDQSVNQVNWDRLYNVNYNNIDTILNANGLGGTETGRRSKYIIEERRDDQTQLTANSIFNTEINNHLVLSGGIELMRYNAKHFKTVVDLMGGDYFVDVDQFAERDFKGDVNAAQNDISIPNHIVKEGDTYGYNYESSVNTIKAWSLAEFSYSNFDYYLAGNYTFTEFWRTGNVANGRFPNSSKGDSKKQQFNDFGFKAGATYKLTGRHYFDANVAYMTRAPFIRNSYSSPRVNNKVVDNLKSETVYSGDLSYNLRTPFVKARLTGYYTQFVDQTELKSFYHDTYRTFVNYAMTGIDKRNMGLEFGTEIKLSPTFTATVAAAAGSYQYTSRPKVTISKDNSDEFLAVDKTVYVKNFFDAGTPQTAASIGLKYSSPKYWFVGFNANYFGQSYLDFNPERRTSEAVTGVEDVDLYNKIVNQESIPDAFTLDIYGGASWKFKRNYLNLSFNISNVLDKQDMVTGGYEQMRFDYATKNVDKYPSKYFYGYGRTFFVMVSYRF